MKLRKSLSTLSRSQEGNAVAAHVLVQALVLFVILGLIQLGYVLYVRNTLIDIAGQSSRRVALLGGSSQEGQNRARQLLDSYISPSYTPRIKISQRIVSDREKQQNKQQKIVTVEIVGQIPLVGPFGGIGTVTGRGSFVAPVDTQEELP
ncbi:hypothetical protein KRX54_03650 [Actinomycetaceae bacterium TAE3-ERU4]|nr:hypothetical protein [Actinomycetaceae bacterium TAE3-ERU4]